jgi:hypothetical protein
MERLERQQVKWAGKKALVVGCGWGGYRVLIGGKFTLLAGAVMLSSHV